MEVDQQIESEFKEIVGSKMTGDEFWNFIASYFDDNFIVKQILNVIDIDGIPEEEKREIVRKYKHGEYKPSHKISLADCYYFGGAHTKGGGVSYFYHPDSRLIIMMGHDDLNSLTFYSRPIIQILKEIDDADNDVFQSLLKLENDMIISSEAAIIDRQICMECGDSVKSGSGKFVNRIPNLDDDQERIDANQPYWWGEYTCHECDIKIRGED